MFAAILYPLMVVRLKNKSTRGISLSIFNDLEFLRIEIAKIHPFNTIGPRNNI
jgi:hypothetical protein